MACSKSKQVAVEEMNVLLCFIEAENAQLENEKNELKVKYHGRPAEERNIMKDVLTMHNEFEHDIYKLREITEDFSKIPSSKNQNSEVIENKLRQVAKMQESIVKFQETAQKLLLCKAHYQMQNDELRNQIYQVADEVQAFEQQMRQINELEDDQVFIDRVDALEAECDRLTDFIGMIEQKDYTDVGEIMQSEIVGMSERQAFSELKRISIENRMFEEAILQSGGNFEGIKEKRGLRYEAEERKKAVGELRKKLESVQATVKLLEKEEDERLDGYQKNLKILDAIIGKKGARSSGFQRKTQLIDDIEATINRAKALVSPTKFK